MPGDYSLQLAAHVSKKLLQADLAVPGLPTLADFFEQVYLASLKQEEGRPIQMRLIWLDDKNPDPNPPPRPASDRWQPIRLKDRIPLTVSNLVKLCKAADPWTSSIAVYSTAKGALYVWGLFDQTVHFNMMLVREASTGYPPPGLFQVVATGVADLTVYRGASFVARLRQDKLITKLNDVFWDGPVHGKLEHGIEQLRRWVRKGAGIREYRRAGFMDSGLSDGWIATLCRILISINRYGHGGAVLLSANRRDLNVKYKINYKRLSDALYRQGVRSIWEYNARQEVNYSEYHDDEVPPKLYRRMLGEEASLDGIRHEITGCVRFVSSLANVDGLVLLTRTLDVTGFGVEILTKKDPQVVYLAQSAVPSKTALKTVPCSHFGTRHRSMMRFCNAHPDAVGFVVSQDGEIRAITKVRGLLVMWEDLKVHFLADEDIMRVGLDKKNKSRKKD